MRSDVARLFHKSVEQSQPHHVIERLFIAVKRVQRKDLPSVSVFGPNQALPGSRVLPLLAVKMLIISSSPRRDGNSFRLAQAAQEGAREAGHEAELVLVDDYITSFLRDCRLCRNDAGDCTIDDRFGELFLEKFIPADGVIFATPIYWYGMSGQLKTFFDRTFCFYAASCPNSGANSEGMVNKRIGLLLTSEETYPGAELGLVHQLQEYCRYTHSSFVDVVRGFGNKRGDVDDDPCRPLGDAKRLGAELFDRLSTDYCLDTPRGASVWS